jgi:hypothetical protein
MFNLKPSMLEQEIYAYVTGVINDQVKKSDGSDEVYNEAQKALMLAYEEIVAQRFAALHFKYEAFRAQKEIEHAAE